MRHSAVTMAEQLQKMDHPGAWDILFCSDMLNLAEFRGLADTRFATLPTVAYFHENQLTYPAPRSQERDLQLAFTNVTTALAANAVWFNSEFHQEDFLQALAAWMKRMPDHRLLPAVEQIRRKSKVLPPSIAPAPPRCDSDSRPLHLVWSARWEYDKNPALFFAALRQVRELGIDFQVSVLGESFQEVPEEFARARQEFSQQIVHWGFLPTAAYRDVLASADVAVSTADHEFFGISAVEAIEAGAFPLLPERLAYPELLGLQTNQAQRRFFYDGSAKMLSEKIVSLARQKQEKQSLYTASEPARAAIRRFHHETQIARRDSELTCLVPR